MEVYHASMVRVERPDVYHSRKFLDFGQGFYVTTLKDQAVKYAQRFIRRGKEAWLNIYELDEDFMSSSFIIREFEKYDANWLDFVVACRKGIVIGNYDIVKGGIANDKVFRTVDLFFPVILPKRRPCAVFCLNCQTTSCVFVLKNIRQLFDF